VLETRNHSYSLYIRPLLHIFKIVNLLCENVFIIKINLYLSILILLHKREIKKTKNDDAVDVNIYKLTTRDFYDTTFHHRKNKNIMVFINVK